MKKRGQISLEFSILFLAMLVVVVVSVMIPGMYGYKKTIEVSSASINHAAMSKLKSNIDILSTSGVGSKKIVYLKVLPGKWTINNRDIILYGNGYNISTKTNIDLETNNPNYESGRAEIIVELYRYDNSIYINWTN